MTLGRRAGIDVACSRFDLCGLWGGALIGTLGASPLAASVRQRERVRRIGVLMPLADSGLISYGPDVLDQYRRKGAYVDRILKGEKPADLPVQTTTKYELVVNLKTAKALGLDIPATVLAGVDDVME